MIIFAHTRDGFKEIQNTILTSDATAWINNNILSPDEINELRANGVDITNFSHVIDPTDERSIEDALSIIAEHHPGRSIWVERINDL